MILRTENSFAEIGRIPPTHKDSFLKIVGRASFGPAALFRVTIRGTELHIFLCQKFAKLAKKLISVNVCNHFTISCSAMVLLQFAVISFNIHAGLVSMYYSDVKDQW